MKIEGVLLAAFIFSSAPHSSNPFDLYIVQLKSGDTSPSFKKFAQSCGVSVDKAHPRYALSVGSWVSSKDLPADVLDAESDYFSTAELQSGSSGAKIVNLWTVDLEQDIDTWFCFASDGHLRFLEATNYTFNDETASVIHWIYKQRRTFGSNGRLKSKTGHFEDAYGQRISRPQMDADEQKNFDWVPSGSRLKELGLPASWQQ